MITELVEYLARALVRNPDGVAATGTANPGRIDVALQVAYEDFGRVIGKNGQTIGAIRTLAAFAGRREGVDVTVEVVEEAGRKSGGPDAETD